ncbi:MAG: hypothetical protein GY765_04490 [bacterium]|nr:hypothetical protein [bacterium]
MIKDPLNTDLNAYELLAVDGDITPQALPKHLQQFAAKMENLDKLAHAQQAARILSTPAERLAIDVFYYSMAEADQMDAEPSSELPTIDEFLEAEVIKDEDWYTELDKSDFSRDFSKLDFSRVKMQLVPKFDNLAQLKQEMDIDD